MADITDIFEPFYTDEVKKIIAQNRQVLEYLKKGLKKNLSEKISIVHSRQVIISNKLTLNSGDIILRPIKRLKTDLNLDLNHYGIIFGTTIDKKKLVLEITHKKNVHIISLTEFLDGRNISEIDWERKPNDTSFETIIRRAEELQYEFYSSSHLNCRHFVNYCVYGIRESKAVQNISKIVTSILDIVTEYLEINADFQNDKVKKTLNNFSSKIKGVSNIIRNLK